ncbi:MAG: hypothetical protein OEW52_08820 [Thermoleophilia bacterium]|nr:hypothetical protein [Thermoleophilia bacterium]MDH4339067.1 hypothetical protein [Thermoleophilia bacterium]MDH5281235.1 hypothetical protein [Thermoleophilia bacterium]
MHNRSRRRRRLVLVIAAAAALAFAAYAFTAANTVPGSSAGDGAGVISGYTVSNIAYQLEAGNPANIDSVSFDLSAAAGTAHASVVSGGALQACTNTSGNSWSCDFSSNPTVLSATSFRVVAVQ